MEKPIQNNPENIMTNIFYIRGLESDKNGLKFKAINNEFGDKCNVIELDYDWHNPVSSIENMLKFIDSSQNNIIVGSSLGGFYANILAKETDSSLIAINPAYKPNLMLSFLSSEYRKYVYSSLEQPMITLLSSNDELFSDYWSSYSKEFSERSMTVFHENTAHRFNNTKAIIDGIKLIEQSSYF
jgi:predicted esterase YcpF (UPF0227 family)